MANKKPAKLNTFIDYCNRLWTESDWKMSDADFFHESDRSLVILMATRVEDSLKFLLTQNMPCYSSILDDRLFGGYKPLSTFSSRIDIAHALGLITPEEARKLHYLREIRNSCAHTDKHISFEVNLMRGAAELIVPDVIRRHLPEVNGRDASRTQFIGVASFYCAQIYLGREKALEAFLELFVKDISPDGHVP